MITKVQEMGNSLGNIIPSSIVKQLKLKRGTQLKVELKDGQIVITPVKVKPAMLRFSEADLLSGLTPHLAHADELIDISGIEAREW